jgi:hypothetical protein
MFGLRCALTEQHPIGSGNDRIVQQSMQERIASSHIPLGRSGLVMWDRHSFASRYRT